MDKLRLIQSFLGEWMEYAHHHGSEEAFKLDTERELVITSADGIITTYTHDEFLELCISKGVKSYEKYKQK